MRAPLKMALILGPAALVPLEVFRLARRPSESPFGNAHQMLFVMVLGGLLALGYGAAALRARRSRGQPGPWLLGAGLALSPPAYFVLWNAFFRAGP